MARARKLPPGKKAKGKSGQPKSYGVYFDESWRPFKDTGDSQYVFTSAVLKDSKNTSLESKYLELRKEMTYECLKIVPQYHDHGCLRNGLLEIHAVDLYQSKGIYNEIKKVQPEFWRKQHEWIRLALQYAAEDSVRYFAVPIDSESYKTVMQPSTFEIINQDGISDKLRNKLIALYGNPYFVALPMLLREINAYLLREKSTGRVYCHTNDETNGFSSIVALELIQERGHLTQLNRPEFKTCSEKQIIQAADVAGYVILQYTYSKTFNQPLKPEFRRWFFEYVLDHIDKEIHTIDTMSSRMISAIALESIFLSAVGSKDLRASLQQAIPVALDHLWNGTTPPEPLRYNTYKPPSEDGDLSRNSVADPESQDDP